MNCSLLTVHKVSRLQTINLHHPSCHDLFLFPTISGPMALGLDPNPYQGDQPPSSQLGFFGKIHLKQDQMPSQARGEHNRGGVE